MGSGIKQALDKQPNLQLINDEAGEQFIVKIPKPEKNQIWRHISMRISFHLRHKLSIGF
jgi:hypothetical protein